MENKVLPANINQQYNPSILLWIFGFLILLRIVFIRGMGMMPQDAYYFFYSEHLALSYFDHPPVIAYMLRFFTVLFGKHVFVIKLADTVVTGFMAWSFWNLAGYFLPQRKRKNALLLLGSTLLVTILCLVSTPDIPLLLFWSLSLTALYKAIFLEKKLQWILVGIFMGLAFDSKYTGIFLPAGTILFLLLSQKHRRYFRSPWFYLSVLLFLAIISPVIIWNADNGFSSFKFQSESRMESVSGINPLNLFGVIGHQAAILMPILFFSLVYFIYRLVKRYYYRILKIPSSNLFLLSFFLPVFLGFFLLSVFYWVKLNWMMPAYLTGIIWLSIYLKQKWVKAQLIFSAVVHLLLAAEVLFYFVPVKSDDTWEGWKELSQKVNTIQQHYQQAFIFSADDYKTSAVLNFYLNKMVYSRNVIGENALQFDFIGTDLNDLAGRDAIYIDSRPGFSDLKKANEPPKAVLPYFDSVTELDPILVHKNDKVIRKFLVYRCRNYHPALPTYSFKKVN